MDVIVHVVTGHSSETEEIYSQCLLVSGNYSNCIESIIVVGASLGDKKDWSSFPANQWRNDPPIVTVA